MASLGTNIDRGHRQGNGIVSKANSGNPPKGDFERMARRRFQNPKPKRRGEWWTLRVWKTTSTNGQLKRTRERVRLAPATMSVREVQKVAAEYLRPLNQGFESIGSATNFNHYVETTYIPVVMPGMAKSTQDRYKGVIKNYLIPALASCVCVICRASRSNDIFRRWRVLNWRTSRRTRSKMFFRAFSDPLYSSSFWRRTPSRAYASPHKGPAESEANRTSLPNSSMNSSHAFQSHTRQ